MTTIYVTRSGHAFHPPSAILTPAGERRLRRHVKSKLVTLPHPAVIAKITERGL